MPTTQPHLVMLYEMLSHSFARITSNLMIALTEYCSGNGASCFCWYRGWIAIFGYVCQVAGVTPGAKRHHCKFWVRRGKLWRQNSTFSHWDKLQRDSNVLSLLSNTTTLFINNGVYMHSFRLQLNFMYFFHSWINLPPLNLN